LLLASRATNEHITGVLLADLATETLQQLRASERNASIRRQLAQAIGQTDDRMSFTVPLSDCALVERDSSRPGPLEGGGVMAHTDPSSGTATDTASTETDQGRLRYMVGDLEHYTEWTAESSTIENYYEQYRRGDYAHDVVIERRAVVER
jgi:hypothetical protein